MFCFRVPFGSCAIYVTPYSALPHPHPRPRWQQEAAELYSRGWNSPQSLINTTNLADGRVGRPKLLCAAFCTICNSIYSLLVITTGEKEFSLLQNRPYPLWGPLTLLLNGCRRSFPVIKRPWREADHSTPPRAELKDEWSYTTTAFCLQHVGRENL